MRSSSVAILVFLVPGLPPSAAQPPAPACDDAPVVLSDRAYNDLVQRLSALEAALAGPPAAAPDDGGRAGASGRWTTRVGGRMHLEYVNFLEQNADSRAAIAGAAYPHGDAQDYVAFRRLFLLLAGEHDRYDYRFDVQLAGVTNGQSAVQLRDVYFGVRDIPLAGYVRVGYLRAPMGLEEMTRGSNLTFMERSLPDVLTPQRQLGICAENATADENLAWSYGAYFDGVDNYLKQRENDNQGLTLAARATCTPLYDEASPGRHLVQFGASCRYTDDADDAIAFRARPEVFLGPQWIDSGVVHRDAYHVVGLEQATIWGPGSVQAEFLYAPVGAQRFSGAYVYGSWFLTGENRVYNRRSAMFDRVTPHADFRLVPGAEAGCGAVELAARWSQLDLRGGPGALAGVQRDLTLGVTWYWTENLRWMLNYIHSWNKYEHRAGRAENDILGLAARFDF